MSKSSNASGGVGIGMVLFLIFMVLKLCHTIAWSWWWVSAPLWIPPVLILALLAIAAIGCVIAALFCAAKKHKRY